uniref:Phytanoyl-CoA dioxygenase n=1 Tax=Ditylum brightwellii TaxID=49249 RepID=A0A7S1ZH69_9STRA|mmetsp:Transcript_31782/g.47394  ORF Transcript_31782/g.47394 Transcript_31782/m.47394 type:complete len:414 (+) Transcript_31782:64-1305(+)
MSEKRITPISSRRFVDVGKNESETREFLKHLEEHGYAIAASVANPGEIDAAKSEMWDFLEGCRGMDGRKDTGVRRENIDTWHDYDDEGRRRWMGSPSTGIISGMGVGQAPFMWRVRSLPGVTNAFAAIWDVGQEDLLVSFDGANVFRPWQYDNDWKTRGGWYHIDQNAFNPGKEGKCCVQGFVLLTDANEETGSLVVVPGSHKHFREVSERNTRGQRHQGTLMDFVQLAKDDEVLETCGGARLVCARAGDLVLWDSRTVHCNSPALTEGNKSSSSSLKPSQCNWDLIRMVAYVCMTPSSWATDDVLEKRWDAYVNNLTTTHWPHEFVGGTMRPNLPSNDPSLLSEAQKKMIGGRSSEPPASATDSIQTPLTEKQREARDLLDQAEETEAKGNHLGAMRLYKQAYRLDPSLEFP